MSVIRTLPHKQLFFGKRPCCGTGTCRKQPAGQRPTQGEKMTKWRKQKASWRKDILKEKYETKGKQKQAVPEAKEFLSPRGHSYGCNIQAQIERGKPLSSRKDKHRQIGKILLQRGVCACVRAANIFLRVVQCSQRYLCACAESGVRLQDTTKKCSCTMNSGNISEAPPLKCLGPV